MSRSAILEFGRLKDIQIQTTGAGYCIAGCHYHSVMASVSNQWWNGGQENCGRFGDWIWIIVKIFLFRAVLMD